MYVVKIKFQPNAYVRTCATEHFYNSRCSVKWSRIAGPQLTRTYVCTCMYIHTVCMHVRSTSPQAKLKITTVLTEIHRYIHTFTYINIRMKHTAT